MRTTSLTSRLLWPTQTAKMSHRCGYNRHDVTSLRLSSGRSSGVVDHEAADVAAVEHVAVALVDVVQAVPGRDELVELELPGPVQLEQLRDRVERVTAAEQRALNPLLEQRELEPRQLDGLLVRAGQPGEHDRAALADRGERG